VSVLGLHPTAKYHSHKTREVGEGHHHMQRALHRGEQRKKRTMENPYSPLHLSALICKALKVQGVNSEKSALVVLQIWPSSWGSRRYQELIYGETDSRKDALDHQIRLHTKKQCFSLYVGLQPE